jgi:hypothetical protein
MVSVEDESEDSVEECSGAAGCGDEKSSARAETDF